MHDILSLLSEKKAVNLTLKEPDENGDRMASSIRSCRAMRSGSARFSGVLKNLDRVRTRNPDRFTFTVIL